jgi:hypothetical protein
MKFGEFVEKYGDFEQFFEFKNIDKIATDHIEFDGDFNPEEFDEDEAESNCENNFDNYHWDEYDYHDQLDDAIGVWYDDYSDDPNFDAEEPEDWAYENPKPAEKDFDNAEDYQTAVEEWEEQYQDIKDTFESAVEDWQSEMDQIEKRRDEYIETLREEQRDEYVENCVNEARSEHEGNEGNDDNTLTYRWEYNGDTYEAGFEHGEESIPAALGGGSVDDVWTITFEGPSGYSTTKKNNARSAVAIYSELIAATKKLYETYPVNGFTFTPAEAGMGLVYRKFFEKYLSKDFEAVTPSLFLRKSLIEEKMKRFGDEGEARLQHHLQITNQEIEDKLSSVRSEKAAARAAKAAAARAAKAAARAAKIKAQELIGKLVTISHPRRPEKMYPGVLLRLEGESPFAIALIDGQLQSARTDWTTIRPDIQLPMPVWQQFMMKLKAEVDEQNKWRQDNGIEPRTNPSAAETAWALPDVQAMAQKYTRMPNLNPSTPRLGQQNPSLAGTY